MLRKLSQVVIARDDFNPRIRHADQRLLEIVVLQAASAQHGSSAGAARAIDQRAASWFRKLLTHFISPRLSAKTRNANLSRPKKLGPSSTFGRWPRISSVLLDYAAITRLEFPVQ
jgi:hypothetical protein